MGAKFESIGKDAAPRESFIHAHEDPELLLFFGLEEELSMNDAGSGVVDGQIRERAIRAVWNDQSWLGHEVGLAGRK